ncbi:MAG TPA: hypothetical protein VNZ52_05390 [Candidatus Thermoplasmatota archaeon]|nr:hypothetical protein [Candidatus Thermoplasmatota archaeon]
MRTPKLTIGLLCLSLLTAAASVAAIAVDTHAAALEGWNGCSGGESSGYYGYQDNSSYAYGGYGYGYEGCSSKVTIVEASASNDGQTVAAASVGGDAHSYSGSAYEYSGYGYDGSCYQDPEWNWTWCTYNSTGGQHRAYSHDGSASTFGASAYTAPTGEARADLERCYAYGSSSTHGYWWYSYKDGNSSGDSYYENGHSRYSECFRGVSFGKTVNGTSTGLDGASAGYRGGYEKRQYESCYYNHRMETQECASGKETNVLSQVTLTVPGVGTFSSNERFQPENPDLLP